MYNEVWAENLTLGPLELPEALKRKKCRKNSVKRKKEYGRSIDERPEIVDSRTEADHWEGDTVLGKHNVKEAVVLTLLEKKTQHYIAIPIPEKTGRPSTQQYNGSVRILERHSSVYLKRLSWTTGRSLRVLSDRAVRDKSLLCSYISWERAQNKRENGLRRRYGLKGVSIENFTGEAILWAADAPNNLP
ncbi:IS30 family transposase [Clostridiales bacterium NSJ-40]|uniref:IS30 family transposase n=1 Tax=Yeguia hominis TaxID=2763662 RepID=A0A926D8F6_9FIRM|nr:IS30 family transposase [Yeguia hominis]